MAKVWEIINDEALVDLANLQWDVYGTKLDFLTANDQPVNIQASYPSLDSISKTMRKPPEHQQRGEGW